MNATLTTPAVVSPALCRLWKRATEARIIAGNAAARAAAVEAAALSTYTAAREDWKATFPAAYHNGADVELPPRGADLIDADAAFCAAMDAAAAAARAAAAAATLETYVESAVLRGDNRAARYACKAAIYAERAARAA